MHDRLELQSVLEHVMSKHDIPRDDCDYHVYFQPPMSLKLKYPCIRYERSSIENVFADNGPYRQDKQYTIVFMSKDPDDPIVDTLSVLPKCSYNRHYTADNLYHDVFTLYY